MALLQDLASITILCNVSFNYVISLVQLFIFLYISSIYPIYLYIYLIYVFNLFIFLLIYLLL